MRLARMPINELGNRGESRTFFIEGKEKEKGKIESITEKLINEFNLEFLEEVDEYGEYTVVIGGIDPYDEKHFRETYKELKKSCN